MTFTDDNKKQVEETLKISSSKTMEISKSILISLLARLEVSERLAEHHSGHDEDCDELEGGQCSCGYEKAETAWRKAAGK